jgi:hypothetical protein
MPQAIMTRSIPARAIKILLIILLSKQSTESFETFDIVNDPMPIAQAMADVTNLFFIEPNIRFQVTIFKPISTKMLSIVDQTMPKLKPAASYQVQHIDLRKSSRNAFATSSVMFVDLDEIPFDFNQAITLNNKYAVKFKFLLYTTDIYKISVFTRLFMEEINEIEIAQHEFILQDRGEEIDLVTLEWFEHHSCDEAKAKVHNTFDKKSQKWKQPLKYFEKFRNFNKCPIRVKPFDGHAIDRLGKTHSWVFNFFAIVAQYANITPIYMHPGVSNKIIHFQFDTNRVHDISNQFFSPIFRHVNIGYLITKGENYTVVEKLLMPFDSSSWGLLLAIMVVAYLAILIINRLSDTVQDLVYGEGVRAAGMNVLASLLGLSQPRLPRNNFARFILTMYVLFCYMYRNLYQGMFVDFVSGDMRKPTAETLDEIFSQNYKIMFSSHEVRSVMTEEQR